MKVPVGVSKRHVHLTKEVYKELFGHENIVERNKLNQPGEFASTDTVDISIGDKVINKVRVVGPFRSYNQIEVSKSDADLLGVDLLIRKSGNVEGTRSVTLSTPKGSVSLTEGLVIAERHIHLGMKQAKDLDLANDEKVLIYKNNINLFDAAIKIHEPSYTELHIDEDQAKEYNLNQGDEVEVYKCLKSEI